MAAGTGAVDYSFTASATGVRPANGHGECTYHWAGSAVGRSPKVGGGSVRYNWTCLRAKGENGVFLPPDDRWRVSVQACRGGLDGGPGPMLAYDVNVTNLVIQRNLSDGCDITCDINPNDTSAAGLQFKSYAYYIHLEKIMLGKRRIWATGITQPSDVDEQSGVLHLKCKGFAAYPKGIPWLEDLNWLANDAYEPIVTIWQHLQSFPNGNLDVTVTPTTSGIEMLPGYAFDGNLLNLNFFATFVRQTDKLDSGDYINALARDVPFDYMEISEWNPDRTGVNKTILLGYPRLGLIQQNIAFVLKENVLSAKPHTEAATEYASDVGVSGFFPGVEYSAALSNADPDRLRRYLDESDAMIDSNERAAAWAHRRLARRQTPPYWETITINPEHPNAPMGTFDVGDTITVQGFMPWVGYIAQEHKIIAISIDVAKNVWQLSLKAEGAFNYDPIFFPDGTSNIIENSGFDYNLNGWAATGPGWTWDGSQGATHLGSATITADGTDHDFLTQPYGLSDFQIFPIALKVKCSGAVGSGDAIQLVAQFYDDDQNPTTAIEVAAIQNPAGMVPWQKLAGNVLTPVGSTHVALRAHVAASMTAGQVWIDDGLLQV
jgi:hypothetical protein